MAVVTIDSYSESNCDSSKVSWEITRYTQSFMGDGSTLTNVKLYLKQYGSPQGNCDVGIYSHTGTYGTNSEPDSNLAISEIVDASLISNQKYELVDFAFLGDMQIVLERGVPYVIQFNTVPGSPFNNYLEWGGDSSSPTHGGNAGKINSWDVFSVISDSDFCFYVYGTQEPPILGAKYPLPAFKKT